MISEERSDRWRKVKEALSILEVLDEDEQGPSGENSGTETVLMSNSGTETVFLSTSGTETQVSPPTVPESTLLSTLDEESTLLDESIVQNPSEELEMSSSPNTVAVNEHSSQSARTVTVDTSPAEVQSHETQTVSPSTSTLSTLPTIEPISEGRTRKRKSDSQLPIAPPPASKKRGRPKKNQQ